MIEIAKPGDILLINTGLTGAAIRWWCNSSYNHTANYIGGGKIVDSVLKHGVSERYLMDLKKFEWSILRPTECIDVNKLIQSYDLYKGQKYDLKGTLGFFFSFLKSNNRKMFCSEFTAVTYAGVDYPLIPRKTYDDIHPEMIYQSWKLKEVARFSKKDGLQLFNN